MMIILITACGRKKENKSLPAGLLYTSSRIRYLYKRSKDLNLPFFILSAKYGLVYSEEIIEPYEEIMTYERCSLLKNKIKQVLQKLNPKAIIYYKGGARKEYFECIKSICNELNIPVKSFGFKIMGDIHKLKEVLDNARRELFK